MNKDLSTTKWGRVYLNDELIQRIRQLWLNEPRRECKIAPGIAYTIYPPGYQKESFQTEAIPSLDL